MLAAGRKPIFHFREIPILTFTLMLTLLLFGAAVAPAQNVPIVFNEAYLQKLKSASFSTGQGSLTIPSNPIPIQKTDPQALSSRSIGAPIANPIGKVFRINGESTETNAVFPEADGYLVFTSRSTKQNVTKFDLTGKLLFSRDYLDLAQAITTGLTPTGGWPHSVVKTSDNGYFICGLVDPRPQRAFLVKLNSNFDYQWGKVVTHNSPTLDMWAGGAIQSSDGKYVVLLKGQQIDPYTTSPFFGILKLNSDGSQDWQRRIISPVQTDSYSVLETANAYVIFGGIQVDPGVNDWDLYFGAINKDGTGGPEPLWQIGMGGPFFDGNYQIGPVQYASVSRLVQLSNGDLAVAAYTQSFGTNPDANPGVNTIGKSVLLVSFTSDGTQLSGYNYLDSPANDMIAGPYGSSSLIKLADNNLLLGGNTEDYRSNPAIYPGAFLVKLNADFSSILWQMVYAPYTISGTQYSLSSGGFFALGQETSSGDLLAGGKSGGSDTDALFTVLPPNGESNYSCYYQTQPRFSLNTFDPTGFASLLNCAQVGFCLSAGLMVVSNFSNTPISATPPFTLTCAPDISVTPSPCPPFGDVPVNQTSAPKLFEVTNPNTSNARLILTETPQNYGGQASMFPLTPVNCPYLNLDPGESCTFNAVFAPTSAGAKSTTLRVLSNDPDTPVWDVGLSGNGTSAGSSLFLPLILRN